MRSHAAVGAASPIPAAGCFLVKGKRQDLRVSLLAKRRGNPFSEGSRELFDLAGQGRIDVFFLGGAQIDGEASINLVRAEGRRFPGSFGSAFMYPVVPRTILFREEHSRRVLVPKVEFVSARGDPLALLTGKALFSWQKEKRRFRLAELTQVRAATTCATAPVLAMTCQMKSKKPLPLRKATSGRFAERSPGRWPPTTPTSRGAFGEYH